MKRLADLFERDINTLANLESLDNGKTFAKAVFDIYGCIAVFRYYAGWCDKHCGKTIPADGTNFTYTRKEVSFYVHTQHVYYKSSTGQSNDFKLFSNKLNFE